MARAGKKLHVDEKVEVRSLEDGFLGSWHPGIVIACGKLTRRVKYEHLLVDDESEHLVDLVGVSPVIDGIECDEGKKCNYRGRIRPLPPQCQFGKWDLPYGLCVDVHYQEAWWEGVIFDHEDGSEERRIFFPDLGDEMTIVIDVLRISQDWDELIETWQRRGTWVFLELIEEYEHEGYLPISVKQIWYDVRERKGFEKIREWTSFERALWEELVLDVLDDNLQMTMGQYLRDAFLMHLKADLPSLAIVPVENPANTNSTSVQEKLDGEQLICASNDGGSRKNLVTESYVSHAALCIRDEGMSRSNSHKISGNSLSLTCKKSEAWLPVGPDLVPAAEFCPDSIAKYIVSAKQHTLTTDVRKHLLYLGWKIEYKRDKIYLRFLYTSPEGKSYYSLRLVCLSLMEPTQEFHSPNICDSGETLDIVTCDSPSHYHEQPREYQAYDNCPLPVNSSACEVLVVEPEYCPQAISDWYEASSTKGCKGCTKRDNMTLKARKHLSALGWVFWYARKKWKRELCYESPKGMYYNSLRSACKAVMDEAGLSGTCSTHRPVDNINVSYEAQGHSPSEYMSSAVSKLQKILVPSNALDVNPVGSSYISHSGKIVELGNFHGNRKLHRNRKDRLSHLATHSQQKISIPEDTFLKRSKRRKRSGKLTKFRDDVKGNFPTRVLRSSKRVQRVVVPTSTHRNPRTMLSWLIDNNVILPRAKVQYCRGKDQRIMAEGRVTRDGIKCNCCGNVYTLSSFEVHAGSSNHRSTANIFLEDGRSLLDCQMQIKQDDKMRNFTVVTHNKFKGDWHPGENDYICSVCHYGGELILCDQCPSSFHKGCLGLKDVPYGDWFCLSCCCGICGDNKLEEDAEHVMKDNFLNCHQCERKYHVSCIRDRGAIELESCCKGNWFCSKKCKEIFLGLFDLLGKPISVGVGNLTWTLVKSMQSDSCEPDATDFEALTENYSKLNIALGVMHECFEPVKEPHSQRDLVEDIIFSRVSKLNRLNFQGFYTVLLERNDELITVATVRIYGEKVAEVPLVGTRFHYRRQGMCRILMDELEKGTVTCQKLLIKSSSAELILETGTCPAACDDGIDGSSAVSEVFQAEQIEGGEIVDQGLVEVPECSESPSQEGSLQLVTEESCSKVNPPALVEREPSLSELLSSKHSSEDTTFGQNGGDEGNLNIKCYKRRKIFARSS